MSLRENANIPIDSIAKSPALAEQASRSSKKIAATTQCLKKPNVEPVTADPSLFASLVAVPMY